MKILAGNQIRYCQGLLLTVAFFLTLTSCNEKKNAASDVHDLEKTTEERIPVEFMVLENSGFKEEIMTNGIIKASKKAGLYFGTRGIIDEINFRNGDYVIAGDIIARLNDEAEQIALKKAEADIQAARLELKNLMLGYSKEDPGSVPAELLNNLEIQSGVKQATHALEIARLKLKQTLIIAPFNGILGDISYQVYNMIPANEKFCQLMNMQSCFVEFFLLESELGMIQKGMPVRIKALALEEFSEGSIVEVDPIIDKNGLFGVKAIFAGKGLGVMDGMHAEVFLEKINPDELAIPKEALIRRSGKEMVFTYHDGKAVWNYVKIGKENALMYQVIEGLQAGDTVILDGNLKLSHGSPVRLKE
ncbi:MAG: efflux RND transporter periplasmic adaptor subunit [Bacteroidota bacterium]|nr:efflux RND transporter periplasmic adaptor subunit [Bacteroidota bacterium]